MNTRRTATRSRAPGERLRILDETLEVVRRLWTEDTVTFQGKHLTFDGAYCDPKPIQQLPEIWVGGGGEQVTLRIAARHADKTNWQTGIDAFEHKSGLLAQYCDEIGRDFDTIVRTHGPDCVVFDTEADMHAWLDSPGGGSLWGEAPTTNMCATTSWGPPRWWARRCRRTSTRAVASSSCGSATSRAPTVSRRFARDVVPAGQPVTRSRR